MIDFDVTSDGMLVISHKLPFELREFTVAEWEPHHEERRIWYPKDGQLLIPRGLFHLHINGHCCPFSWDGYRCIDMRSGHICHDLTTSMPPRERWH